MYCKLSLSRRSSSSSSSSMPLSLPSSLNTPSFLLLGKPIQQQPLEQCNHQKTTSHNKPLINDINKNPMRHINRIRQLFLPVCAHTDEHEIANHYKDVKNKKATKEARAKAKLYRQQQLHEQRKKAALAKLVSTAFVHRRRPPPPPPLPSSTSITHHRQFDLSHQRNVLQIPTFTFPR